MGRPGGTTAKRPLHFIWLCDCSGSMKERGKIQQLNFAIRDAIPHMRRVAAEHVEAQFFVRAIQFSRGASWILEQPTPIEKFSWTDLVPDAVTDMGAAINLVADALEPTRMENRGFPPVLVLITDGGVTDTAVFAKALHRLRSQFWGQKAVRIAVAIGQDAEHEPLEHFTGKKDHIFQANNASTLVEIIRFVSTAVVDHVSAPKSQPAGVNAPVGTLPSDIPKFGDMGPDSW